MDEKGRGGRGRGRGVLLTRLAPRLPLALLPPGSQGLSRRGKRASGAASPNTPRRPPSQDRLRGIVCPTPRPATHPWPPCWPSHANTDGGKKGITCLAGEARGGNGCVWVWLPSVACLCPRRGSLTTPTSSSQNDRLGPFGATGGRLFFLFLFFFPRGVDEKAGKRSSKHSCRRQHACCG